MAKPTYVVPNLEEWLQKFHFQTEIKVRYSETDMSGHVNNTSYMVYFEQARVEYWVNFASLAEDLILVTADIWCHYHSEAFFPEALEIGVRVARIGNSSLDLEYAIHAKENRRLVATGAGTIVVLDRETKKPAVIPDPIREAIAQIEKW